MSYCRKCGAWLGENRGTCLCQFQKSFDDGRIPGPGWYCEDCGDHLTLLDFSHHVCLYKLIDAITPEQHEEIKKAYEKAVKDREHKEELENDMQDLLGLS
jgi:hypothetical protein